MFLPISSQNSAVCLLLTFLTLSVGTASRASVSILSYYSTDSSSMSSNKVMPLHDVLIWYENTLLSMVLHFPCAIALVLLLVMFDLMATVKMMR